MGPDSAVVNVFLVDADPDWDRKAHERKTGDGGGEGRDDGAGEWEEDSEERAMERGVLELQLRLGLGLGPNPPYPEVVGDRCTVAVVHGHAWRDAGPRMRTVRIA